MKIEIRLILPVVSYSCATRFLTFGEEDVLRVLENRVPRKICGPKIEEETHARENLLMRSFKTSTSKNLIFVVPCIMLNSEINPTRCNNCVYSSQWLYSTCFG